MCVERESLAFYFFFAPLFRRASRGDSSHDPTGQLRDWSWLPPLMQLQILSLCNNAIAGGLFALAQRGLFALRELNLSGNAVEDFNELRGLSPLRSLRRLDLRWNAVRATPDYGRLARALVPSLLHLDTDSDFAPQPGVLVVTEEPWGGLKKRGNDKEPVVVEEEDWEDGRDADEEVIISLGREDGEGSPKRARIERRNTLAMAAAMQHDDDDEDDSEFATEQSEEEEEEEEEEDDEPDDEQPDSDPAAHSSSVLTGAGPLPPGFIARATQVSPESRPQTPPLQAASIKPLTKNGARAVAAAAFAVHNALVRPWKRPHTNWQGDSE